MDQKDGIIGVKTPYNDEIDKYSFHNRIEYRNKNNLLHRLDGFARQYFRTSYDNYSIYVLKTEYFINGIRHRDNGPAIELADGGKTWIKNGKLHNDNGSAFVNYKKIDKNGYPEMQFWLNGVYFYECTSVEEMIIKNIIE